LRVGEKFAFGRSSSTSAIARITALTAKQFSASEPNLENAKAIADRETLGNLSDVKVRFEHLLGSK
jgi:hypothetical protein